MQQRKTRNLGLNTARTQEESYSKIEQKRITTHCTDANHEGARELPIRSFYLNKGGAALQGACIVCQKNRRANRIKRCRTSFEGKTHHEVQDIYRSKYKRDTKECSKCKESKSLSEFTLSIGMETGFHNQCIPCSTGLSQGNGDLRDFIFMPDKDGIRYQKGDVCNRCGGTDRLAVDHILPIAKGGTDCISNKQTLCIHCNSKKCDTIDCPVTSDLLCLRYRDLSLDFTDNTRLSQILAKKVSDFKQSHIDNSSLDQIRESMKAYIQKHNLGHNLDRIIGKIAILFKKT